MKKILLLLFTTLLFIGCSKNQRDFDDLQSPNETYKFQSIRYYLEEGEGMKLDTFHMMSENVINDASTTLVMHYEPEELKETSAFYENSPVAENLKIGDQQKIQVPAAVKDGKIVLDVARWKYQVKPMETLSANITDYKQRYNVTPYTKLSLKMNSVYRIITTSYSATFAEEKTGKLKIINGKWTGQLLGGIITKAEISDL